MHKLELIACGGIFRFVRWSHMTEHTGAPSGSRFGAQTEDMAGKQGAESPLPGASVAHLSPLEAAERVASSWVDSIDEALGRAREQLAGEFSIWKRVSQIATLELGQPGLTAAVDQALHLAAEVSAMDQALVLRPVGPGGCGRVAHRHGVTDAVVAAVEGFSAAGQPILSALQDFSVADLDGCDAPKDSLLAPTLVAAGLRALVCIPLRGTRGAHAGTLLLLSPSPRRLNIRDRRLLVMVARRLADLIERSELAERAERDGREMRAILDSVAESIVTIDSSGMIRTANPATERLFGYAADELLGKPVDALIPERGRRSRDGGFLRAMIGGRRGMIGRSLEVTGRRKDGSDVHLEIVISEIEAKSLYSGVMRDITDRKVAESRLRQSDRMASLGTLAAGLGHDMNNVLFPIRAHLNALAVDRAEPGADARAEHVDEIQKGVQYLQQLADGLHYLVHDAGHADGGMDGARLSEWWRSTGSLLSRALPPLTAVIVDIGDRLPRVRASEHALTQAVLNLIVNAGEAMQSGSSGPGHLCVTARAAPDGNAVLLSVSDDGPGMPEAVRRRAFDLFFTTKTRGMGTGLGLAMVQRVAQEAGGSAWIDSAPGKGTTVTLRLPVACDPSVARGLAVCVSSADGRTGAFFESALAGRGFAVTQDPASADAWLVDPRIVSAADAQRWRSRRPRGVLVLTGRPHRLQSAEWRGVAIGRLGGGKEFDALLVDVDQACSIIMERVGNARSDDAGGAGGAGTDARQEEGNEPDHGACAGGRAGARGR